MNGERMESAVMETVVVGMGSPKYEYSSVDVTAENRMWTAVLLQAVLEWQSNIMRASREAEKFLFDDEKDFATVCTGAGLNPSSFREQLKRIRRKTTSERFAWRPLAA
ncbi:MAG: hypothetical protein WBC04_22500 [Candidatus Acidiferrales bacterium]